VPVPRRAYDGGHERGLIGIGSDTTVERRPSPAGSQERYVMPWRLVERTSAEPRVIPGPKVGPRVFARVIESNVRAGVTWLSSYLPSMVQRSYCHGGDNLARARQRKER
jgi:hypothetical protein